MHAPHARAQHNNRARWLTPMMVLPLQLALLWLLFADGLLCQSNESSLAVADTRQPAITLRYFGRHGDAEPIRLTLAALRLPWEEVRYERCRDACPPGIVDWEQAKAAGIMSGTLPFGQEVPALRYEPGGDESAVELVQTLAILRFLSVPRGLYGSSRAQEAAIDMVLGGVADMRGHYTSLVYDQRVASAGRTIDGGAAKLPPKPVLADYLDNLRTWLVYLEGQLSRAADGGRFFVGGRLSVADLVVFDILDLNLRLQPHCLAPFSLLAHFQLRIGRQPGVREYLMNATGQRLVRKRRLFCAILY